MRIYELFHNIIHKFVPMDDKTQLELQTEAGNSYNQLRLVYEKKKLKIDELTVINDVIKAKPDYDPGKDALMVLPKLTWPEKVLKVFELWYVRYLIAIFYIYLVPAITKFINGSDLDEDGEEHEDDYEDYKDYKRWQHGKNR